MDLKDTKVYRSGVSGTYYYCLGCVPWLVNENGKQSIHFETGGIERKSTFKVALGEAIQLAITNNCIDNLGVNDAEDLFAIQKRINARIKAILTQLQPVTTSEEKDGETDVSAEINKWFWDDLDAKLEAEAGSKSET
jgi:hypothetical protein